MVQRACESGTWRSAIKSTFLDKLKVPSDKACTHFLAKHFHYVSRRGATPFHYLSRSYRAITAGYRVQENRGMGFRAVGGFCRWRSGGVLIRAGFAILHHVFSGS